jgi:CubicO group peptidase (beta-lactamase class C family)
MPMEQFESFIQEQITATNLPGLSAAVLKDGEVVWQRAFGYADVEARRPATPRTLYGIASMTKSFTALAILQLADAGKLSLDDPVEKHLPAFALRPGGESVRLWHFLTHSSGIPALGFSEHDINAFVQGKPSMPLAGVDDLLTFVNGAADWTLHKPGVGWYYLNEGYSLLGAIIERLSGMRYADYVTERILKPLGMTRSFFDRASVEADGDAATAYAITSTGRRTPSGYTYNAFPAKGGMISNTEDMARYLAMFLTGRPMLASAESLQALFMPRIPRPEAGNPFGPPGYAYGWQVHPDFFGQRAIEHGGSVLTATSHMALVPEAGAAIVLLTNGAGYPTSQFAFYGLAELLGHDPEALPFVRRARRLAALGGVYRTYRGTMTFRVRPVGDLLQITEVGSYDDERTITVLPDAPGDPDNRVFHVLASGVKTPVLFSMKENGAVEMVYGRYLFRRVGELT